MTLRVDTDRLRRVLAASLPPGARAADLFIESRLSAQLELPGPGRGPMLDAGEAAPVVERRWETGAHLRRFSEDRYESFVLDSPTADSLEALALHPEAVGVDWLTGSPAVGVQGPPRDGGRAGGAHPIEASLSDASPLAPDGPWSGRFLDRAFDLLSSWLSALNGSLPSGERFSLAVSLTASVQEILVLATDRDPARDTRSFIDAALHISAAPADGAPPIRIVEARSAASLNDLERIEPGPLHPAARLAQRIARARDAVPPPRGAMPVIFASPSGGFLLHEICGHLLEADHVMRGDSPFATARGRAIASPLLTLADDGSIPGMRGSTLFDDEGVAARRTPLILEGTLVGYLSDRLTAVVTDGISTGNGRRQSYRDAPMPRMTNLVIDPGRETFEEILARTPSGLLVTRLGHGRVDPATGIFVLLVEEGFLVERGSVESPVAGAVLRGRAAELLQTIDGVGSDPIADVASPLCIKADQALPFGILQPTLRVGSMMVADS